MIKPTVTKKQIGELLETITLFVMLGTIVFISWIHGCRVIAIILIILGISLLFFQKKQENL